MMKMRRGPKGSELGETCGPGRGRCSTEVGDDGNPCAVNECFYCGMRVRGSAGEWVGCDKAQGLSV